MMTFYTFNSFCFQITDKAELKWIGFNVPIGTEEEEILTDGVERQVYKKKVERGWSGKTWPGRTVGPPYTADGGFVVSYYLLLCKRPCKPCLFILQISCTCISLQVDKTKEAFTINLKMHQLQKLY